jgi:hypothetical protein
MKDVQSKRYQEYLESDWYKAYIEKTKKDKLTVPVDLERKNKLYSKFKRERGLRFLKEKRSMF